ncbi:cytochrome P450 [Aaosphaeria arxii CBS 175.79]|uniref:Cytochrome P450 n=1 Tax=Aaosphaeria arxii CBS 175.79 TaxID=1450172 RepID=A0A6A5Y5Z1_9PLEO|nr:cytochrome P450 [Aaosphaeria arxii CBS 175.79]KAF2019974.1 cytochrome P450 [Aaosphaeria arxii CBS 175.79]
MTISFFAATDLATHRHLRSRVQGAYTTTSLLTMEPLLQEVLDANWSRFECFARSGEVIALDKWANYLTFDIVGQLAMGGTIGFIQQGLDVNGIIRSIHDGFWLMANMGNIPLQMFWFNNPIIKRLVRVLGIKRLNAFDDFVEWLDIRVEQRMNNKDGMPRWDMLQHFIEAKDMDKNPVKKADVMIEGVNILGAGADTTAIGILACVGALLKHPEYIPRLRDEIDHAYQQLGLDSSREHIKFTDAQNLPWLSAIIKESTRLHPSIQYQLPRYVPAGGVQIGPYFLPEGTVCGISCRSTNRSKKAFGADAGSFRPERWISQSKEDDERIKYCNSMLTTFGTGSRSCVGKNLATIEMYKYVAQFFRTFDAELLDMSEPWKTRSQWFSFQRDFKVRLRLRDTCVSGGGVEK